MRAPLDVTCPKCAAPAGVSCTVTRTSPKKATHQARRKAARKASAGLIKPDTRS